MNDQSPAPLRPTAAFAAFSVAVVAAVSAAVLAGVLMLRRSARDLAVHTSDRADLRGPVDRIESLTLVLMWLGILSVALLVFLLVQALRRPRLDFEFAGTLGTIEKG